MRKLCVAAFAAILFSTTAHAGGGQSVQYYKYMKVIHKHVPKIVMHYPKVPPVPKVPYVKPPVQVPAPKTPPKTAHHHHHGGGAVCSGGCVWVASFEATILGLIVADEIDRWIVGPACATGRRTRQSYFGKVIDEPKLWGRPLCNWKDPVAKPAPIVARW